MGNTSTPPSDTQNSLCLSILFTRTHLMKLYRFLLLNTGLFFVPTVYTLVLASSLSHREDQNKPGIRVGPTWPSPNQFLPCYQNDLSKNMYIYLISTLPCLMVPFALRIMGWPASRNPPGSGSRLPLTCLTQVTPRSPLSAPQSLNLPHLLPSFVLASRPAMSASPSGFRIFSNPQSQGTPTCS